MSVDGSDDGHGSGVLVSVTMVVVVVVKMKLEMKMTMIQGDDDVKDPTLTTIKIAVMVNNQY